MKKILVVLMAVMVLLVCVQVTPVRAEDKDKVYKVGWSHYTTWEAMEYMRFAGILEKYAAKYKIKIKLLEPTDYGSSIDIYTAGGTDACVMTTMDALMGPASSGIDSEVTIPQDFSNGNDGVVTKNPAITSIANLKGQTIYLYQATVTEYLVSRMLEMNNMQDKEIKMSHTTDSEVVTVFSNTENCTVGTWNPFLMSVRNAPKAKMLFDSSQIPGEIVDALVIHTDAPDALKKALTGAWFETMSVMSGRGKKSEEAIQYMAQTAGGTVEEFKAQLRTTALFSDPAASAAFVQSPEFKTNMERVRTLIFNHGLFKGAAKDAVGIEFPDGSVTGNPKNIKLRFNTTYVKLAADKKL